MGNLSSLLAVLLMLLLGPGCLREPLGDLDRVLKVSWQSYRQRYISPEGRVIVQDQGRNTISEAQSYALLRAVWAGDEATFVQLRDWTLRNLSRTRRTGDPLLSWSWGRLPDGSLGLKDANTATDADLDYALALVLAARRGWQAPPDLPGYLDEARQVAAAILKIETVTLQGGEILLTPGNWHESRPPYLVNPSYFSPAVYRLFSRITATPGLFSGSPAPSPPGNLSGPAQTHWNRLHGDTHLLLDRLTQGLGEQPGVGLFPDWCRVGAAAKVSAAPGRASCFGWEAVRLPWRLALDGLWFEEPGAAELLGRKFLPFFRQVWQDHGRLAAVYNYDGTPAVDYESPVLYAGVLAAALTCGDQKFARLLARKIMSFFHEQGGHAYFVSPDNYYANNWAWLGLALYAGWARDFASGP